MSSEFKMPETTQMRRAPAAIDRRLRDARAGGDALDGQLVDAPFCEQLARGVEDCLLGPGRARAAVRLGRADGGVRALAPSVGNQNET